MLAGQQADGHREDPGPQAAHRVVGLLAAELARSGDEVGLAGHHRCQHALHLRRVVLAVGVGGHDVARAALAGEPVPQPQRGALAAVDRHVGHEGAVGLGHPGRLVLRSVGHHHSRRLEPADLRGQGLDHLADHVRLVELGEERAGRGVIHLRTGHCAAFLSAAA